MTAAYRLKGLGWFAGCVVVTLGFYLVSLQVAAERKKLDQVNARIASTEREIRALDTEFDTRSNMIQLEKWNGDALALVVPTAAQFVKDETALAAINLDGSVPGVPAGTGAIRTAAYVVPSVTDYAPAIAQPVVAAAASVPVAVVTVAPASASPAPAKAVVTRIAMPARPAVAAAAARKAQAVAMLDKSLLSGSTLDDLMQSARAEGRARR